MYKVTFWTWFGSIEKNTEMATTRYEVVCSGMENNQMSKNNNQSCLNVKKLYIKKNSRHRPVGILLYYEEFIQIHKMSKPSEDKYKKTQSNWLWWLRMCEMAQYKSHGRPFLGLCGCLIKRCPTQLSCSWKIPVKHIWQMKPKKIHPQHFLLWKDFKRPKKSSPTQIKNYVQLSFHNLFFGPRGNPRIPSWNHTNKY